MGGGRWAVGGGRWNDYRQALAQPPSPILHRPRKSGVRRLRRHPAGLPDHKGSPPGPRSVHESTTSHIERTLAFVHTLTQKSAADRHCSGRRVIADWVFSKIARPLSADPIAILVERRAVARALEAATRHVDRRTLMRAD